jgi:hypothetical protein
VESCPKQEQLRTGSKEYSGKLSKGRTTSDRFRGLYLKAVQSRGNFGQEVKGNLFVPVIFTKEGFV